METSPSKTQDIFISHATEDLAVAVSIKRLLESQGLSVWVDETKISIGDELMPKITNGVTSSNAFLLLASKHAMSSPYVWEEIHLAREQLQNSNGQFKIYVLRFDKDIRLPVWLSKFTYITLQVGSFGKVLRKLFSSISSNRIEEFYFAELLTLLKHENKGNFGDGWLAAREEYERQLQQVARLIKNTRPEDSPKVIQDLAQLEIFRSKSQTVESTWSNIGPGQFEVIFPSPMVAIPTVNFVKKPEDIEVQILDVSIISAKFSFTERASGEPVNFVFPPGFLIEFTPGI